MNDTLYELLEKVRGTAVQAGDTAANAVYGINQRASELVSTAKTRMRLVTLKGDVQTALRETGEILYATHTGTPTDSEVLLAKLREIDLLKEQITCLESQLAREDSAAVCPTCGAKIRGSISFCGECGGPL